METSLALLKANARKLRSIYGWVSVAGLVGCSVIGGILYGGAKAEGPILAASVFVVGMLAIGVGMLLVRRGLDARILRVLVDEPQRVARVFPKRTESAIHGSTVARYRWIVLELTDGVTLDVYVSADDFERVVQEIRRCVPDASYDGKWTISRTNVNLR